MDGPLVPHTDAPDATVWPPAPKVVDLPIPPPAFHLPEGRGYITSQIVNMAITGLYAVALLWCARTVSADALVIHGVAYLIHTVALIITGGFFLVYVYKAAKAARVIDTHALPYGLGWAVGSYFVPILNLYRPFQIMQAIWRGNRHATDQRSGDPIQKIENSPLVTAWWVSFLSYVFCVVSVSFIIRYNRHHPSLSFLLGTGNALFSLVPAFLSIRMVQAIRQHQRLSAQAFGLAIDPVSSEFQGSTKEERKTDEPSLLL